MPDGMRHLQESWIVEFTPSLDRGRNVALNAMPIKIMGLNDKYFERAEKAYDRKVQNG
jgi:hypothetical protein